MHLPAPDARRFTRLQRLALLLLVLPIVALCLPLVLLLVRLDRPATA